MSDTHYIGHDLAAPNGGQDSTWLQEFVSEGIAELADFLRKHSEFENYYQATRPGEGS